MKLYSVTPDGTGIIFDPQAITSRIAFVHKIRTFLLHPFRRYYRGTISSK